MIKGKVLKWCIYIAPFPCECSKALYNDQFTPSGTEAYMPVGAASMRPMYAGTHFTDPRRMEN